MGKRYIVLLISALLLSSCIGYHRILEDDNGEPILNGKVDYKFTEIPSEQDLIKIDTSAYYVQVFEGRYYNIDERNDPKILIFHNDGFFKRTSTLYYSKFPSRNKSSAYYGGKYRISGNKIELERFSSSRGGKTNYYSRDRIKGTIDENRIIFEDSHSLIVIYEKKHALD